MRVRVRSHRIAPVALAVAASLVGRAALAAPPYDPLRCSIPSNRYALDLFQGPLLAPIRVTGIAGAYAGYAEGIEGMVSNAATPAVREPFSANWLEGDISGSVSIPITLFKNNDFDNSGQLDFDYSNFLYITGGAVLQLGMVGFGANAEIKEYTLTGTDKAVDHVIVGKYHVLGAVRLIGDQFMIGAGARVVTLGVSSTPPASATGPDARAASFTLAGIAPELGFLIRPDWSSFRVGGTFRFPVNAGSVTGDAQTIDANGVARLGGLVVPDSVVLPWEIETGVAVQVGPRPLNPEWIDPHVQQAELLAMVRARQKNRRDQNSAELASISDPVARNARNAEQNKERGRLEMADLDEVVRTEKALANERRARYWNWPREHLLVTADLLITGAAQNGVSILRFLGQNAEQPSVIGTSGQSVNFSPRFGIETEPVPTYVHTRFGSYYEPKRFTSIPCTGATCSQTTLQEGTIGRQHFTFGADLRLFQTTWFGLVPPVIYKVQASIDIAPRYQSASLGIGVWH